MRDKLSLFMVLILGFSTLFTLSAMSHGDEGDQIPYISEGVLIPWAEYERNSSIGHANYTLGAVCDSAGFEYELNTFPSEGGGGLIGGGGLGTNISIGPIHKTYPEVRGEFLENMGILYDSYKEKEYEYELVMKDPPEDSGVEWNEYSNPSAYLSVNLRADLIPWWVRGFDQKLRVEITYEKDDLAELMEGVDSNGVTITVSEIRVMAKTDYSADESTYTGEDIELYSSNEEHFFHEIGDSDVVWIEAQYPEETNVAGIYVEITATMEDHWGRSELAPFSGGANPINIYPMDRPDMVKGIGIPLSWYLLLASFWLVVITIIIRTIKGRWSLGTLVPAAALSILAPFWFYLGMNAAMEILGNRLEGAEDGLTWGPGFYLAIVGALLVTSVLGLAIYKRVREKRQPPITAPEPAQRVFTVVGES